MGFGVFSRGTFRKYFGVTSYFFGVGIAWGSLGLPGGFTIDFAGLDFWGLAGRSFGTIVMSTGSACESSFDTILL